MSTPQKRPPPADSDAKPDDTFANHPKPNAEDLYPTIANDPDRPRQTARPALYPYLSPPLGDDEIGRLAHFRVLQLLGAGGMGVVFLAEDDKLGRRVALKVMKLRDENQANAGQRFLNEARAIAQIKHDNLVTIYEVGQDRETCFYVMELLAGETLESSIKRVKSWRTTEILRIGHELASGLAAMHEAGLIHRDIKPTNVWLESRETAGTKGKQAGSPRVKILDFGLVRDVKEETGITESGIVLGTPAFMSPEQVRGKKVDARTDLFSFGCILYRLCTGRYPHAADNSMAQLASVVADEPEPVSTLNPEIPPALARLVMQLLSKNPDDRPKSAAVVAERLRQLQQNLLAPESGSTSKMASSQIHEFETAELRVKPSFWSQHWIKILLAGGAGVCLLGFCMLVSGVALFMLRPPDDKKGKGPPPPPPAKDGKLFLTDLKPVQAVSWPFFAKKDKDKGGKDKGKKPPKEFEFEPIVVNGQVFPHGLFMHAAMPFDPPASLTYQLDRKFSEFTSRVSINDTALAGSKEPIFFAVYGDGKQLWKSRRIVSNLDAQDVTVDVKGVAALKLEVTIDGKDVGGAHGVWIEPLLKR